MVVYNNPIVLQRADPWVLKVDGEYYFTASDPEYNCIAIRHASSINDLQKAPETVVWRKHESGPASIYIWAPELHRINGAWYIYFAGAATDFEASGLPTHRMFVLENTDDDPTSDNWVEKGQIITPIDSFALDATTEVIDGVQYLVWAQKDPAIEGNSNLYIAKMANPWTLGSEPVMLTKPEYDWECIDFLVNEGPAFLFHENKIYITYSASGTGVPYAVGLLTAERGSDLLDKASPGQEPGAGVQDLRRERSVWSGPQFVHQVRGRHRGPDDLPLPQLHGNQGRSAVRPESPRARRCGQVDRRRSGFRRAGT